MSGLQQDTSKSTACNSRVFTFSAGTGSSCHRFLVSWCRELIWFLSGPWRSQTSIASRGKLRSPGRESKRTARCGGTRKICKQHASRHSSTLSSTLRPTERLQDGLLGTSGDRIPLEPRPLFVGLRNGVQQLLEQLEILPSASCIKRCFH